MLTDASVVVIVKAIYPCFVILISTMVCELGVSGCEGRLPVPQCEDGGSKATNHLAEVGYRGFIDERMCMC